MHVVVCESSYTFVMLCLVLSSAEMADVGLENCHRTAEVDYMYALKILPVL